VPTDVATPPAPLFCPCFTPKKDNFAVSITGFVVHFVAPAQGKDQVKSVELRLN
jgi:hypothetical protein